MVGFPFSFYLDHLAKSRMAARVPFLRWTHGGERDFDRETSLRSDWPKSHRGRPSTVTALQSDLVVTLTWVGSSLETVPVLEYCPSCGSDDVREEVPAVMRCSACGHFWAIYLD